MNLIQYNRTTSMFEKLISRLKYSYFPDVKSIILTQDNIEE